MATVSRRGALVGGAGGAAALSLSANAGASAPQPGQALAADTPLVSLSDYEAAAQKRLSPAAWAYFSGGSADEITLRHNREALDRLRLKPRALVDVTKIDTSVTLLGQKLPHPILLAPISSHLLAHPDAEVATAKGAGLAQAILVASTVSNRSIEDIRQAASQPVWFQLYVGDDRGAVKALIQRAEAAGCKALCITADNPLAYARNREERTKAIQPQLPFPNLGITAGPGGRGQSRRHFNWADLEWIRSFSKTPIVLKGLINPDDADEAAKRGVDAMVVSNHGGRVLDTGPASIEALPLVADRVAGRVPILFDSGVRRGTDIVKALAHGASAVLIGRPYVYGLSVGGPEGVQRVVEILRTELEGAMALTGKTRITDIDRSVLWPGA